MVTRIATVLLAPLAAVVLLYLVLVGWAWWQQERMLFFPTPLPAGHRLAVEPDVHEVAVPVEGGAQLSVLHLRLASPRGVVVFLPGNAGNLASWFPETLPYRAAGLDLVMPDYRGYGKSTGRITSEAQLHADVRAVWAHVAQRYEGLPLVVYGRSLGSALAARLAADLAEAGRPPAATVLVSPFTRAADVLDEAYPWIPAFALRYPLDTTAALERIPAPVLLLHGSRDEVIPVAHSRRLADRHSQARLVVVDGAGHQDIHRHAAYQEAMAQILAGPGLR
jgi:uncharacterized protein